MVKKGYKPYSTGRGGFSYSPVMMAAMERQIKRMMNSYADTIMSGLGPFDTVVTPTRSAVKKKLTYDQHNVNIHRKKQAISDWAKNYDTRKFTVRQQPLKRGVYRTSGRIGKRYHGRRQRRNTYYYTMGSVKTIENGGTHNVGGQNTIYLGHGPAVREVWDSVTRAVVKLLMKQAKRNIDNWDEGVDFTPGFTDTLRILFTYKDNPALSQALVDHSFDVVAGDTYHGVAVKLENAIATTFANDYPKEIVFFRIYHINANNESIPLGKVLAKDLTLKFNFRSRIAIQNRTLALTGTDDHDADNVANNPLVGKLYVSKKRLNAFKFKVARPNLAVPYVADAFTGLIKTDSTLSLPNQSVKPPPYWFFDSTHGKKVKENPGEIFSHVINYSQSMKLNNVLAQFRHVANNGTLTEVKFGHVAMFGLEKMLDSGRALGENISLAYEINQRYSCAYSYRPHVASAPIYDIGTAAI